MVEGVTQDACRSDALSTFEGKTALVTGGTSGIGWETSLALAGVGANVVIAARNKERNERACTAIRELVPSGQLSSLVLDLGVQARVRRAAEEFTQRYGQLDLLINNAGIMATPRSQTEDGLDLQFATNHFGHFALTMLLMPMLAVSPVGRVVSVTSIGRHTGRLSSASEDLCPRRADRYTIYESSKLANLVFAVELQRRLRRAGSHVRSLAAHPGYANTHLADATAAVTHSHWEVPLFRILGSVLGQSPKDAAQPTLRAATCTNPDHMLHVPSGWLSLKGQPRPIRTERRAAKPSVGITLWERSVTATKLDLPW